MRKPTWGFNTDFFFFFYSLKECGKSSLISMYRTVPLEQRVTLPAGAEALSSRNGEATRGHTCGSEQLKCQVWQSGAFPSGGTKVCSLKRTHLAHSSLLRLPLPRGAMFPPTAALIFNTAENRVALCLQGEGDCGRSWKSEKENCRNLNARHQCCLCSCGAAKTCFFLLTLHFLLT